MPNDAIKLEEDDPKLRGRLSPRASLKEAMEGIRQVYANVGAGPYSRVTIAAALGHSSENGASNAKVGNLTHFGLLDRTGSVYRLSSIGQAIVAPTSEAEEKDGIVKAAKSPGLYADVLTAYSNKALPAMLANLLARNYGVLPKSSEDVAQRMRETFEFAGLLRNGILYADPELPKAEVVPATASQTTSPVPQNATEVTLPNPAPAPSQRADTEGKTQSYTISLGSSGKIATITVPIPFEALHVKRISKWVEYMSSVVDDEDLG